MIPLRDENPSQKLPFITIFLIAANSLAFLYEASLSPPAAESFIRQYGATPALLFGGGTQHLISLVTAMFLHGGWGHLIGNMWFLWIFGDNIEDFLGHTAFLVFYILGGFAATLAHAVLNRDSSIPLVGASGAIAAILGAYMILHPRIRVKTLVTLGFYWDVVFIPALWFLAIWFVFQVLGGFDTGTGIAYAAHIGGFVAGVVMISAASGPLGRHSQPRYEARRRLRW